MGDPAPGEAGNQAVQQPVVDEPNDHDIHSAQPEVNYQVPPPEKLNLKPDEWLCWIRRFERFRNATGLDQKDGESQVKTLIYSMGEEADDIVVSFGITAVEANQYDVVKGKFEAHFGC